MFKLFLISIVSFLIISCHTNPKENFSGFDEDKLEKVISEMPNNNDQLKHQVLVLGSYHFDRQADGSDVQREFSTDIKSPENQESLNDLIEVLQTYNPTMIALEFRPGSQSIIDSLYSSYVNSEDVELGDGEFFQIGFRLGKMLGLEKMYCVDNRPPFPPTVNNIDDWEAYADSIGHSELMQSYDEANAAFNNYSDETFSTQLNVFEHILALNSGEYSNRTKELFFSGLVHLGAGDKYVGADLTGNWYRRNTRIFTNVFKELGNSPERVLIVYGATHKFALDEIFEAAPEFEVVQITDLLSINI
jgi:hypothetical protein